MGAYWARRPVLGHWRDDVAVAGRALLATPEYFPMRNSTGRHLDSVERSYSSSAAVGAAVGAAVAAVVAVAPVLVVGSLAFAAVPFAALIVLHSVAVAVRLAALAEPAFS